MSKTSFFISTLIFLSLSLNTFAQQSINRTYSIGYNMIYVGYDINLDGKADGSLIYALYGYKSKEFKNESAFDFGGSYAFFYGHSQLSGTYVACDFPNEVVNYTGEFRQKTNSLYLHLGYKTFPLNKKKSFTINLFLQPGIGSYKYITEVTPSSICAGVYSHENLSYEFLFNTGVYGTSKIFSNKKKTVSISINYGALSKFIDLSYEGIYGFVGVELNLYKIKERDK